MSSSSTAPRSTPSRAAARGTSGPQSISSRSSTSTPVWPRSSPACAGGVAGGARAPGIGPAVGRAGAEQLELHAAQSVKPGKDGGRRSRSARAEAAGDEEERCPGSGNTRPRTAKCSTPQQLASAPAPEIFPSQSDAESWLGEVWPELLHAGVEQVTLREDDRKVYGPMSLRPEPTDRRSAAD